MLSPDDLFKTFLTSASSLPFYQIAYFFPIHPNFLRTPFLLVHLLIQDPRHFPTFPPSSNRKSRIFNFGHESFKIDSTIQHRISTILYFGVTRSSPPTNGSQHSRQLKDDQRAMCVCLLRELFQELDASEDAKVTSTQEDLQILTMFMDDLNSDSRDRAISNKLARN